MTPRTRETYNVFPPGPHRTCSPRFRKTKIRFLFYYYFFIGRPNRWGGWDSKFSPLAAGAAIYFLFPAKGEPVIPSIWRACVLFLFVSSCVFLENPPRPRMTSYVGHWRRPPACGRSYVSPRSLVASSRECVCRRSYTTRTRASLSARRSTRLDTPLITELSSRTRYESMRACVYKYYIYTYVRVRRRRWFP